MSVTAISHAGHSSSASTTFVLNRTPPLIGNVQVRWSLADADWRVLQAETCLPSAATFVEVRWSIYDAESEVVQRHVALAATPQPNNATAWQEVSSAAALRVAVDALPGQLGASSFLLARACNRVGLCATSNQTFGLMRDERPPSGGHVEIAPTLGVSVGFAGHAGIGVRWQSFHAAGCPALCSTNASHSCYYDPTCLGAVPRLGGAGCNAGGYGAACRFCGFDAHEACPTSSPSPPPSLSQTLQYDVCIGTTPYGCQVQTYIPVASNTTWQGVGLLLPCDALIYATVRATSCAGLQRAAASRSVKYCCDGPTSGSVNIVDVDGNQLSFVGNVSFAHVNASWSGFAEPCSGVRQYSVSLVHASGGDELWNATLNSSVSTYQLPMPILLALPDGGSYLVIVSATSHAGLTSTANASFVVDRAPPAASHVQLRWTSSPAASTQVSCIASGVEQVEISWPEWADATASVSYSLAGDRPRSSRDGRSSSR